MPNEDNGTEPVQDIGVAHVLHTSYAFRFLRQPSRPKPSRPMTNVE
jgi:hypothetical protein